MSDIKVTPLGAGQDVGRSCILLTIGGKNIMLDCGMHMGYNDDRRFADFNFITKNAPLTEFLDCVIISHFHLDHCGALPYMSEVVGYEGPIYMTHPTKAIAPILLEDYRKITVDRNKNLSISSTESRDLKNFFSQQDIKNCMKKVKAVNLHQTIHVDDELEIKAYYAGHVLGAAMFHIKVGQQSVVYTGDYNMTPDRHLGAAWIDKCRPDLLITESTYATTIRDSKRCRERDFLLKVHSCVEKGGKVLIPVFALGRAQELCILLETYWDRMNLNIPIYFAVGLTEKATNYYKMFITWTNQKIKKTFVQRNMFDFKHIRPFDRQYIDNPGAMVVFATPGMLHAGLSLQIFKAWAPYKQNMVIMPGYCVAGTIGHKILGGERKIELENKQCIDVNLAVEYMSFSAHADAKGIMQLIQHCEPKNVLLVHGEAEKMKFLAGKIRQEFKVDCYMPENGVTVAIPTKPTIPVDVSLPLLKRTLIALDEDAVKDPKKAKLLHGTLVTSSNQDGTQLMRLVEPAVAMQEIGIVPHQIRFTSTIVLQNKLKSPFAKVIDIVYHKLKSVMKEHVAVKIIGDGLISISSAIIKLEPDKESNDYLVYLTWNDEDDFLGCFISDVLKDITVT